MEKKEKKSEEVTILTEEYEKLKEDSKEKQNFYEKYLRAHAELENALKRFDKDKEALIRYSNESFIMDFLPIVDSLEIAEKHVKEAKDFNAVQQGVDMIHGQIQKFLKELGVEKVKALGEKYDPHVHEAIETLDSSDKEDDIIIEELKAGYKLNGKLIRPASVKVARRKA